jgi:hypothetical protein
MERRLQRDQQLEGTAKPTEDAKKVDPRPWELEKYIYQESLTDDGRSSHSDPRLELALRLHQESDFIPSDGDDEYGFPVCGTGFTPQLDASASTTSDQGTLAGGSKVDKARRRVNKALRDWTDYRDRKRNPYGLRKEWEWGSRALPWTRRRHGSSPYDW